MIFIPILFPAKILNLRIEKSIDQFFDDMEKFFSKLDWDWLKVSKTTEVAWENHEFEVLPIQRYEDDAIKSIRFVLNIPSVKTIEGKNAIFAFNHIFRIEIPREYPARVDKIKIITEKYLFHPRFSIHGIGEACLSINGEIDRVLMDIVFNLLFDPKRIRPPKLFSDADYGLNSKAMKWYQDNNPNNIHLMLLNEWAKYREHKFNLKNQPRIEKRK